MVRIENWAVVCYFDPTVPVEQRERYLTGAAYGHPRFDDGHQVQTSAFVGASRKTEAGHVVTTVTREYLLGEPSPAYLQWLHDNNIPFDPEQPIQLPIE